MDPCSGSQWLQIVKRPSGAGWNWKFLKMPNRFGDSRWRCCWRDVQVRFGRQGRWEGKATSDRRRIWESALATKWKVTSHSCQIQLSWLRFVECWMATMTRHQASITQRPTQMSGTGRSRLISSKKIVAWNNHTVWQQYANATWRRNNCTKSICDHTHCGKWWMTFYMVRIHTTVPFLLHSSWNWDTMWNYCWYKWRQQQERRLRSM